MARITTDDEKRQEYLEEVEKLLSQKDITDTLKMKQSNSSFEKYIDGKEEGFFHEKSVEEVYENYLIYCWENNLKNNLTIATMSKYIQKEFDVSTFRKVINKRKLTFFIEN